jgi:hypothetical protein
MSDRFCLIKHSGGLRSIERHEVRLSRQSRWCGALRSGGEPPQSKEADENRDSRPGETPAISVSILSSTVI